MSEDIKNQEMNYEVKQDIIHTFKSDIELEDLDNYLLNQIYTCDKSKNILDIINDYLINSKTDIIRNILLNNINNLINEDYGEEHKTNSINWFCNNSFNFWNEINFSNELLHKIISENKNNLVLENMLQSITIRNKYKELLKEQNSKEYNFHLDINKWINNKNLNEIHKIIKLIKLDHSLYFAFVKYFNIILKQNLGYSIYYNTNKVKHEYKTLYNIYRTLLSDVETIKSENIREQKELNSKENIIKNVNLDELLYATLIRCYKVLYTYPIDKYFSKLMFQKNNNFEDIINDENYFIYNDILINLYIIKNDNYDYDILDEYIRIKNKYNIYIEDKNKVINNIIYILNKIDFPKPIKYNILQNLISITDKLGFGENKKELLNTLLNILTDIEFMNFVKNSCKDIYEYYRFYKNLATCVNKLTIITKDKYEDNNKLLHFLHNLCVKSLDILDTMKRIITNYTNLNITSKTMNFESYNLTVTYELSILISLIETILSIMKLLNNLDSLETVLIMPLSTLVNSSIDMFKDKTNIIYSIFNKNYEIKDILEYIYELIYLLRKNSNFNNEIEPKLEDLQSLLERVKINKKEELEIYFKELKEKNLENLEEEIYKDCPEEFTDPLYFVIIKDPVMIPNTNDTIFDKNSIIGQIFHNGINPYTREKLTLEEFEEYNKREEVKNKIEEFKNKFNTWKEQAIIKYKASQN